MRGQERRKERRGENKTGQKTRGEKKRRVKKVIHSLSVLKLFILNMAEEGKVHNWVGWDFR